jgi:hypothetical protein
VSQSRLTSTSVARLRGARDRARFRINLEREGLMDVAAFGEVVAVAIPAVYRALLLLV